MVNVCKQYGFIYQGSEIYGGLANTLDYGPLGSLLKKIWKILGEKDLFKKEIMPMKWMQRY